MNSPARIISIFLFSLLVFSACKPIKYKVVVFEDEEKKSELTLNGTRIQEYEFNGEGMYAGDFRIYDDVQEIRAVITRNGETLVDTFIKPGTHLVNLSPKHEISFEEIAYGRYCIPCKSGKHQGVVIMQMSDNAYTLPFPFNKTPPKEITTKDPDNLSDRQFFRLTAYTYQPR